MDAWPRVLQTPSQLHLLVNASKSLCCEVEGCGVVQSSNARTVAWAARPLAVGSRPVLFVRKTKAARGLRAKHRSARAHGPSGVVMRWLASSTRCAFEVPVLLVHALSSKLGP